MILLIDNYDSFVHNLARYFARLGQATQVVRNDAIDVAEIRWLRPQAIVISPGPCTPNEAGCSLDVVRDLSGQIPILGVCLGHQAIGAAFGGELVRSQPVHGRSSLITHDAQGVFKGIPSPLSVGRYHSLAIAEAGLPPDLKVTARSQAGVVMGLAHRRHPTVGVQFHPESILTEGGYALLANFLRLAGMQVPGVPPMSDESPRPSEEGRTLPAVPVTF
jgi:anthranilate synthase/aminodeoxychorismate synthase-like glutamine amidotransferase